jgi:hypothetical protein
MGVDDVSHRDNKRVRIRSSSYIVRGMLTELPAGEALIRVSMNVYIILTKSSGKVEKSLICKHTYCWISTNMSKISQIHGKTLLVASKFCLKSP